MLMRVVLPAAIVAVIVAVPLLHKVNRVATVRNLRVVEPDVFYRSGQMRPGAFERVLRERNIRTVFSVRESKLAAGDQSDEFEKVHCEATGRKFHRLPQPGWEVGDHGITGEETVRVFLNLLADPEESPRPMLLHCFAGEHRTGAMVAVYRMEYNGWRNGEAIEEMTSVGNIRTSYAKSLLTYLTNYAPRRVSAGEPDRKR